MGLPGAVIGILSQNHHPDLCQGSVLEGVEHLRTRWIYGFSSGLFGAEEGPQLLHIGEVKLVPKRRQPTGFKLDIRGWISGQTRSNVCLPWYGSSLRNTNISNHLC